MMFAYIVFFAISSLFLMFLFLFIVATIMDYYHYRQHRTFYELQRDYSKPRKPAAK